MEDDYNIVMVFEIFNWKTLPYSKVIFKIIFKVTHSSQTSLVSLTCEAACIWTQPLLFLSFRTSPQTSTGPSPSHHDAAQISSAQWGLLRSLYSKCHLHIYTSYSPSKLYFCLQDLTPYRKVYNFTLLMWPPFTKLHVGRGFQLLLY